MQLFNIKLNFLMSKFILNRYALILYFLFCSVAINAQEKSSIIESYTKYAEAPRELVYAQLNKSTYIKGELIGLKAYVLSKNTKSVSKLTTNLYVNIKDKNNNTVKQKLLKVENGVANFNFEIDSSFTSGYYTVKAYTNWMKNFNENNHHEEQIRIIDPDVEEYIDDNDTGDGIDIQFLPESGHLLNNIPNNVGVIIKNDQGHGIPNTEGEIYDNNNLLITKFRTNHLGIGSFQLIPDINNSYKAAVNYYGKSIDVNINTPINLKGIIMSVKTLKSKAFISITTNDETFENIKNQRHTLMLHNGDRYDIMDVYFTDNKTITKSIDLNNAYKGINILTLFNESDKPIAERLFFNYEGIELLKSNNITTNKSKDSLELTLNLNNIKENSFNSLSVSVLPKNTKAYNRNDNLLSSTFLKPYLKGYIEHGEYYFNNIDAKKKYDLDLLLLTQGWSSYDWNEIFNYPPERTYNFEQGILVKANRNNKSSDQMTYVVHSSMTNEPVVFEMSQEEDMFSFENIFPTPNEQLMISEISKRGTMRPAEIYLQSFPSDIPDFNKSISPLNPKSSIDQEIINDKKVFYKTAANVYELQEVILKGRLEKKRIKALKLTKTIWGDIFVFDDNDRQRFATLTQFINNMTNLRAYDTPTGLVVQNPISYTRNTGSTPFFFLDDMPLYNTNILINFPMFNVDYIEVNTTGIGEGIRGGNGTIKIYTKPELGYKNYGDTVKSFKLPLTFSVTKKFYTPKYKSYKDDFFQQYGVVDWLPNLKIQEDGNVNFKIPQPKVPVTLFIEGVANDGAFISEEKTISLN